MKANLKGLSGIKGLVLLHGEKLVILAVGICTLLFVYYSMQLERLDDRYQAEKLRQEINLTNTAVQDFNWEKALAENPDEVRIAKKLDKDAAPEVDPEDYPFVGVDPPVIRATVLRSDPSLVAAVEPLARGGSGTLPFLDEKVMIERQKKRQAAQEQKDKEEAERLEREQAEQQEGQDRGGGGRDRRRGGDEGMNYEYDPENPDRRPLETVAHAPGAQVMGDERIERAFWAIIVAKVPIKEQLKLYRDAFENTRGGFDPQYDFPRYCGYIVQRAEVLPGKDLQWVNVDVYDGQGKKMGQPGKPAPVNRYTMQQLYQVIQKEWATQMPELVDPRYLDPEGLLAFPLPPLLGRDWGSEVTHPDIPLAGFGPPMEEEIDPALETPATTPGADEDGFSRPLDPSLSNLGRPGVEGMGGRGLRPGGFRGDDQGGRGGGRYGSRMGGGRSMFADGERGGRGGGQFFRGGEGGMTAAGVLPKGVEHWLLRFIDFSVEPGKKYKYRVQLALDDPNHIAINPSLVSSTLDSAVLNRQREDAKKSRTNKAPTYRFTDWSEPSPTVGIPLSGSVRLASAKVPGGKLYNEEPATTLLVESFDLDEEGNAIHAAIEEEFKRGYVANMIKKTEYIEPDGKSINTKDSFKFLTGITVVDVAGGEQLTRDFDAPARVLLLDPSGELYIRNELDDAEAVNLHKLLFTKPKKPRDGEEPMGRGGPGGFFGGRRGER